ncbi:MAG: GNAT family N-acetyltransferase [Geminicoccaceae bacterium]
MSQPTLRRVGRDDLPLLIELARAFRAEDGHPLRPEGERALAEVCAGEPLARGYLIEVEGRTVGYTVLGLGFGIEFGGRDVFVDDLYIVPEARGRGLGKAVMTLLETEARGLGAKAMHLVVDPENAPARAVYSRAGFEGSHWLLMSRRL